MGDDIQGSVETVPKDLRQLRACLVCSLVKTFDQVLVINEIFGNFLENAF